jgi:transcriptional regulator of acetoin/glycerol metabolism
MRALLAHDWPGNVRELENALEYAVAVCRGQTILPDDLPDLVSVHGASPEPAAAPQATPAAEAPQARAAEPPTDRTADPAAAEGDDLRRVLEAHQWRRGAAAKALGISRSTLWRRMRDAGLG